MANKFGQGILAALGASLICLILSNSASATQITRYEVINAWLVECRAQRSGDDEDCLVRSGPHVARTGPEVAGFTLTVGPKERAVAVESKAALGLEARVDRGELFATACEPPVCSFSAPAAKRLLANMRSGSVLHARIVTSDGEVVGRFPLNDFREALAIAKQPRGAFPARRLTHLDLRTMQALLADQGYDPGPHDGVMGPRTRKAIISYQQDNALNDDGTPTKALLLRMRSEVQ